MPLQCLYSFVLSNFTLAPYPFRVKGTLFLSLSGSPCYRHPIESIFHDADQMQASEWDDAQCRDQPGRCNLRILRTCLPHEGGDAGAGAKAKDDFYDVAYQASTKDLLWMLFLDDPSRPHDRQKPKNGPWLFPPGTRLVDPDSSCIPCFSESDMPATLRAAGFRAVRDPDPASNFVSIQKRLELCVRKPPGLCDEEDRKEEGTDKGAPESSEKNTSVYIRI